MGRRGRNRRWLDAHRRDPYVLAAAAAAYRSRAAYKLAEIDAGNRLVAHKRCIVDLGAAPGSWSQYCRCQCPKARVIALDRRAMAAIDGVECLRLDFAEPAGLDGLLTRLGGDPVDLVLSDMAPNLTGVVAADQAAAVQCAELALDLCCQVLAAGGDLLIKVFHGEGFEPLLTAMRNRFAKTKVCKPEASRDASRETYILGRGWRG